MKKNTSCNKPQTAHPQLSAEAAVNYVVVSYGVSSRMKCPVC